MQIDVKTLSQSESESMNITEWPVWEKAPCTFEWFYDTQEICLIISGEAQISAPEHGITVTIKAGDFVVFPKGLACRWTILKTIKKYYNFA